MPVREGGSYEIRDGKKVRVVNPPKPGDRARNEDGTPVDAPALPPANTVPVPAPENETRAPRRGGRE